MGSITNKAPQVGRRQVWHNVRTVKRTSYLGRCLESSSPIPVGDFAESLMLAADGFLTPQAYSTMACQGRRRPDRPPGMRRKLNLSCEGVVVNAHLSLNKHGRLAELYW